MRYAKITNNQIEYIISENIGENLIEINDEIIYPVFFEGKIIEGYDENRANYMTGKISFEEWKNVEKEKLKQNYINIFSKTDDIIIMYEKRKALNILTERDIKKYKEALEEYYNALKEYREKKREIEKMKENKLKEE